MLRIRTLSVAAAALALSTASALAADLTYQPPVDTPIAPAAPAFTWMGPYVGAILGYGWGSFSTGTVPYDTTVNADGVKIGGYAGYNFQGASPWVFGVEADLNWDDLSGRYSVNGTIKQNWDSTARLRGGYSFGRVLAYGTAGAAVSGAELDTGYGTDKQTHWGWTVGAGAEAMVTQNVTARLEYQFADYGSKTYETGTGSTADVDFHTHTIRAGLGYKF